MSGLWAAGGRGQGQRAPLCAVLGAAAPKHLPLCALHCLQEPSGASLLQRSHDHVREAPTTSNNVDTAQQRMHQMLMNVGTAGT